MSVECAAWIILYPAQGHWKFLKHLVRLAMQTRAPAWCEIDRKRLLRHTACCFLLLSCASRGEPHGATYPPSPTTPLILLSLYPRRIPISHIILFPANPVLHLPSLPESSFWHQTDYYARIVGTLWVSMSVKCCSSAMGRRLSFSRLTCHRELNGTCERPIRGQIHYYEH